MDQHSVTFSSTTGNLKYHDIICKTPSLEVFDQLKKLSIAEGSAKAVKKNKRQWVDISTKIDADEEAERINAEKATRGAGEFTSTLVCIFRYSYTFIRDIRKRYTGSLGRSSSLQIQSPDMKVFVS